MNITFLCCTHGRPYFLTECVESFRRQIIPRGVSAEMLILNDCPEQTLRCSTAGVRIVDIPMVADVSDKLNAGFEEESNDPLMGVTMEGHNCLFSFAVLPSRGADKIWSLVFKEPGEEAVSLVKEGKIVF